MYLWRKLNAKQRKELQDHRHRQNLPWHSLPHRQSEKIHYLLSAACYEHQPIIGRDPQRMTTFQTTLQQTLGKNAEQIICWCVLPNHYHALVETHAILELLADVGRMHGRLSFDWNGEEGKRGRKVWFNCAERYMRSDRHFWTSVNYVHHNPVHHGYALQWQDWPFSSAAAYLEKMGKVQALEIWRKYPLLDYGKSWDGTEV